jgi:dolichol-phosphate mannosyltransferase
VFDRRVFLDVPRFNHMHRFMPALFQREGYSVISVPVNHRNRTRGQSKYGLHNRLWVGIVDLFGMIWLKRRASPRVRTSGDL